jgi:hypothetical protein
VKLIFLFNFTIQSKIRFILYLNFDPYCFNFNFSFLFLRRPDLLHRAAMSVTANVGVRGYRWASNPTTHAPLVAAARESTR